MSENIHEFFLKFNHSDDEFNNELKKLSLSKNNCHILRKSIDARNKKNIKFLYKVKSGKYQKTSLKFEKINYKGTKPVIIGTGPAGLFAAYALLKQGVKPLILEKGKKIRNRNIDMAKFLKNGQLNVDSNICFGEGGAGTFSDGKLYTRNKGGYVRSVLEIISSFVDDISVIMDSYPHIGSGGVKKLSNSMTEWIKGKGGEFLFETKLLKINLDNNRRIKSIITTSGEICCDNLILAAGHSSDEIFFELDRINAAIEFKPFAAGFRIEHKAALIDKIRYGDFAGDSRLGHAEYRLVNSWKNEQRTVYTFCMCPGGYILNAATNKEGVVSNGMSLKGRKGKYSNSAVVCNIKYDDLPGTNPLKGLFFQREIEQKAALLANRKGCVHALPAANLINFLSRKNRYSLPESSSLSPVTDADLHEIYPSWINTSIINGIHIFDRKMQGFVSREASLIGVETRTSSPVRVLRDRYTLESQNVEGLFPTGEGSGYAGGITSSAVDGIFTANSLVKKLKQNF